MEIFAPGFGGELSQITVPEKLILLPLKFLGIGLHDERSANFWLWSNRKKFTNHSLLFSSTL